MKRLSIAIAASLLAGTGSAGEPISLNDEYLGPDDIWLDDELQSQYRIM